MNHKISMYLSWLGAFLFFLFLLLFWIFGENWLMIVGWIIFALTALQAMLFCRCPDCGHHIRWKDQFCSHCGAPLDW